MAKRANKRRTNGKQQRTADRASTQRTSTHRKTASAKRPTVAKSTTETELSELAFEPLEDPFFYESPFPPEVVLEAVEAPPAVYTPAMIARRRKLRTFVAMVVGVAATIMLLGLGRTMLDSEDAAQQRSMTVPVSP